MFNFLLCILDGIVLDLFTVKSSAFLKSLSCKLSCNNLFICSSTWWTPVAIYIVSKSSKICIVKAWKNAKTCNKYLKSSIKHIISWLNDNPLQKWDIFLSIHHSRVFFLGNWHGFLCLNNHQLLLLIIIIFFWNNPKHYQISTNSIILHRNTLHVLYFLFVIWKIGFI